MKEGLNDLIGYTIETKDGIKGTVKDFLFDEEQWIIRYLVADLGIILPGEEVIIPQGFLKQPNWIDRNFPVDLTIEALEKCPPLASNPSVSREYEEKINSYYNVANYWVSPYMHPLAARATYPARPLKIPSKSVVEENTDNKLRSFNEVKGYYIEALDGKIGHIDDLFVDDLDWQIIYVLMDTKNWVPWSKRVLVGTHWMDEISYANQVLKINLDKETIQSAPEFDSSKPISNDFEIELFKHYESSEVEQ